jgi:hypothetical protein
MPHKVCLALVLPIRVADRSKALTFVNFGNFIMPTDANKLDRIQRKLAAIRVKFPHVR